VSNVVPAIIRVLVVEDSATARELLVHILNSDPAIQVVGVAGSGEEGVAAAQHLLPDVITMDVHLPSMDGFLATRKIMETCPTRIIMVTASSVPNKVAETFQVLEAGALTILARPLGIRDPDYLASAKVLVDTVKLMSEVKVVKRWAQAGKPTARSPYHVPAIALPDSTKTNTEIKLVVIGASTGGPIALQTILSNLPENFPIPILIVQHISNGFSAGFAEWLGSTSKNPVCIATHGEIMRPGVVYLAPDDRHVKTVKNNHIELSEDASEYSMRPSISYLFRSVVKEYGAHAVGILLTGMGRDGAIELLQMRQAGSITIAQNEESSVIFGMPGEAVKLNAAIHILSPIDIAILLKQLAGSLAMTNRSLGSRNKL
jgi:two-component system chemotaxis response regulator CheB